jgi:hypothetical protein
VEDCPILLKKHAAREKMLFLMRLFHLSKKEPTKSKKKGKKGESKQEKPNPA